MADLFSLSSHDGIEILLLKLRLDGRKGASLSSPKSFNKLIDLLQDPCTPFIANQPFDALLFASFRLLLPGAIFPSLP
jgi:hypothetical protein